MLINITKLITHIVNRFSGFIPCFLLSLYLFRYLLHNRHKLRHYHTHAFKVFCKLSRELTVCVKPTLYIIPFKYGIIVLVIIKVKHRLMCSLLFFTVDVQLLIIILYLLGYNSVSVRNIFSIIQFSFKLFVCFLHPSELVVIRLCYTLRTGNEEFSKSLHLRHILIAELTTFIQYLIYALDYNTELVRICTVRSAFIIIFTSRSQCFLIILIGLLCTLYIKLCLHTKYFSRICLSSIMNFFANSCIIFRTYRFKKLIIESTKLE